MSSFQTKGTNDNNTTHPRSSEQELAGKRWVGAAGEVSTEPGQQPYLYTPLHQTAGRPRQVTGPNSLAVKSRVVIGGESHWTS